MKNIEMIDFGGSQYKAITIEAPFADLHGEILFIEDTIETALMPGYNEDDFDYVNDEAQEIDEAAYGFVPAEWFALTKKEFIRKIKQYFD